MADRETRQRTRSLAAALLLVTGLATGASPARAEYPERPVRIIVPYGAGGIADLMLRHVAQKLSVSLGQQFIIDNRPGAAGITAISAVVTSAPDGYTLAMIGGGLTTAKSLFKSLPYDLERDLIPISSTAYYSLVIAAGAGSPYRTVADVITKAKAEPGKINFGTISPGSNQHLSGELFRTLAGIDVTMVPYKTTPAVVTALIRGEIDVAFDYQAGFEGALSDNKIIAIATTGTERSQSLPDALTVAESGLPKYEVTSWNGIAAPARTPAEIVALLNRHVNDALRMPDVKEATAKLGMEARGSSVEELREKIAKDIVKWGEVIEAAGIPKK